MSEVKPCPFCGGNDIEITSSSGAWMACCKNEQCGMMGFVESEIVYYEDMLKKWNKRESSTLLKALREAVNKIEFYGDWDSWEAFDLNLPFDNIKRDLDGYHGGKQAREYLKSETYLNIKHLLEEDKK